MTEDIRDRIGKVRDHFEKSQEEFGSILGVTKSTISLLETKKRDPSDRLVRDVCREFGVNEEWIRTGEGDMFGEMDSADITYNHFGYVMGNGTAQKKAVLSALVEMVYSVPDDKWDYIFNQFEGCLRDARKQKESWED